MKAWQSPPTPKAAFLLSVEVVGRGKEAHGSHAAIRASHLQYSLCSHGLSVSPKLISSGEFLLQHFKESPYHSPIVVYQFALPH